MSQSISSVILCKDKLFEAYFVKNLSKVNCAKLFNVNVRTIDNNFKLYNWKFRSQHQWTGRKHSDITKKKMSEIKIGKKYSDETNLKKGRPGHVGANKGKTKETNESIKQMALKLAERNKFNCLSLKRMSEKRKNENKLNSTRVRKQAISHFVNPTTKCKKFLLDFLTKCNETSQTYMFYLAKKNNFRTKDIERNLVYLKINHSDLFKSKVKDSRHETRFENEIIIPHLKKIFSNLQLKRQVRIQHIFNKNQYFIADIVLYKNDKPYIIVESKVSIRKNNIKQERQLKKYLILFNCKYGLLTNGYKYQWYIYNEKNHKIEMFHNKHTAPLMIDLEGSACSSELQMQ